jgi:hypothetical protein
MALYHKIVDGQEVFNNGTSLKINGRWVSNPTPEMYEQEGWSVFVRPTPVPVPQDEPDYEQVVEAIKRMLSTDTEELSDEDALEVAALYRTWFSQIGKEVAVGTRLWDDGKLWKVIQPHTVQDNWRPENTPALFVEVSIEEWPPIPENIPAENPWMAGQKGTWKGQHYICNIDNCVWNPDVYPQAWQLV